MIPSQDRIILYFFIHLIDNYWDFLQIQKPLSPQWGGEGAFVEQYLFCEMKAPELGVQMMSEGVAGLGQIRECAHSPGSTAFCLEYTLEDLGVL